MTLVWTDALRMTVLYIAVNATLMLLLGMLVTRARVSTGTPIGDGGNSSMVAAIRAHANNTENVALPLLMMATVNALGAPVWIIHAIGVPLTLGRVCHAVGLSRNVGPSLLRLIGMTLTWLAFIVAIAACGWLVFVPPASAG
jgi:uncharacterized membrane protein YecN with MAPEG domain